MIQTSLNGRRWTTAATVRASNAAISTHRFRARTARYVRIVISQATQGTSPIRASKRSRSTALTASAPRRSPRPNRRPRRVLAGSRFARPRGSLPRAPETTPVVCQPVGVIGEHGTRAVTAPATGATARTLVDMPGLEQIGRTDLEAAAALYGAEGLAARRIVWRRGVRRFRWKLRAPRAARALPGRRRRIEARLCNGDGECAALPAGRHDVLPEAVSDASRASRSGRRRADDPLTAPRANRRRVARRRPAGAEARPPGAGEGAAQRQDMT